MYSLSFVTKVTRIATGATTVVYKMTHETGSVDLTFNDHDAAEEFARLNSLVFGRPCGVCLCHNIDVGESLTFRFPESKINTIDNNGFSVTRPRKGVVVKFKLNSATSGQVEVFDEKTGGDQEYAVMALELEGRKVVAYDGVFDFPREVRQVLECCFYDCSDVVFEEQAGLMPMELVS